MLLACSGCAQIETGSWTQMVPQRGHRQGPRKGVELVEQSGRRCVSPDGQGGEPCKWH